MSVSRRFRLDLQRSINLFEGQLAGRHPMEGAATGLPGVSVWGSVSPKEGMNESARDLPPSSSPDPAVNEPEG